jgi:predicted  nucleic acid-binding Zn-ribbon protein
LRTKFLSLFVLNIRMPKHMNMKAVTKVFLCLAAIGGVISGCATKSEFKDLKKRMDVLESNKIQSIEGQISSIDTSIGLLDQTDNQLDSYITALKEQLLELEADGSEEHEALRDSIKALQAVDESLHKQIDELKAYVDTELNCVKDWASATFVTLEEYNKTVDVIADIQANLDTLHTSITNEYKQEIEDAIRKSTESMKTWVNEQLTGYYDIATMNTKLDSLKSALGKQISEQDDDLKELIGQNTKDIATLESDLKQAKIDITDAYKKAIEEAITKYDGTITETLQKEIDSVNETIDNLDERVTDIETKVANLEKRMDEVEKALKSLASITYIPKYSDGIERVEYVIDGETTAKDLTLRFDVYPVACAESIVTAYDKDNSILSARAVYTQTRATAGDFVNLDINKVKADNGILTVTVSTEKLDNDFFQGNFEAAVVLKVTTGYNKLQSDYISLIASVNDVTPYLTFSAASTQGFKMTLATADVNDDNLKDCFEYSIDNGKNWTKVIKGMDYVTFGDGKDLLLRGKSRYGTEMQNPASTYVGGSLYSNIAFSDGKVAVACSGDIRTLIDWENYSTASTADASFGFLFCDPESRTDLFGYGSGHAVLSSAPELPSTNLAPSCYASMFRDNVYLASAPVLPATTLAPYCYADMFRGCTALETAPDLPAETLATFCYVEMFKGCTNLKEVTVNAKATTDNAFLYWLEGVAASGKIHKRSELTLPSGISGIPSGWTVIPINED